MFFISSGVGAGIIAFMIDDREQNKLLLKAGIIAPILYVVLYSLDNVCTYLHNNNIEKVCQLYTYNDVANTILTFGNNLTDTIMPILFMPFLLLTIIINTLMLRPQPFLPRNGRLFRIFSGAYIGLGVIFSIISLATTGVIIYMAIVFGEFWIKSSPTHPINMEVVAITDAAVSIGICLFALVPLLAILPYRVIYKEYDAYLNTYHRKDTKNSFRTGILIAILLICLDVFLHQPG